MDAISDEFLSILSKLGEIQTKCRQLLRFHHKTALMELVDETNALQETAYGRLLRWLQQQFSAISPEVSDLPLLLRRCLQALRSRPALFKVTHLAKRMEGPERNTCDSRRHRRRQARGGGAARQVCLTGLRPKGAPVRAGGGPGLRRGRSRCAAEGRAGRRARARLRQRCLEGRRKRGREPGPF